jgi:DNA-binding transcriptional LysR family regulator
VETGSITAAAVRLGVTQSAVSNLVAKLRAVIGDDLFVKAGRGIVATTRAHRLAGRARDLLRELARFAAFEGFDSARWRTLFIIAANDLQREALLPPWLRVCATTRPASICGSFRQTRQRPSFFATNIVT